MMAGLTVGDEAVLELVRACPRLANEAEMLAAWHTDDPAQVRVSLRRLERRGLIRSLAMPGITSSKLWMRA